MSIPPRFLEELRSRLTLSDMIGRKVQLTRAGREFKGCCPFHHEKTPSFYVNDDKQFYHCFGCGAHGDIVGFAMRHDNLSFPEAVEVLAAEAGLQVPEQSPQEIAKARKQKDLYALMESATRFFEEELRSPANTEALRYIVDRGVPEDILHSFRIGYAPADRQTVRKALLAEGYTDAQMIEAGVLRPGKSGTEPYAFFRERIMFPVPDRRGRTVAFGGRILPDHLRPPDRGDYVPAKYMNTGDTPLFHKGGMLYGEPHARQAAADNQPVIVVEGYLDVMAAFRAGYRGAVAPLGTALTEEQVLVLWGMIPQEEKVPVLCFDGDNAGRRAASRACERILPHLKPNMSARIAFLPEGQDPDSLVHAQGGQALKAVIDGAMGLADFLWLHYTQGKRFETPEARAGLSSALEDIASRIPDRGVQHYYRQAFRAKIRAQFGFGGGAGNSFGNRRDGRRQEKWHNGGIGTVPLHRPVFGRRRLEEQALLAALINHPGIYEEVEERLGQAHFGENASGESERGLDRLRQAVLSTLGHNPDLDTEELRNHLFAEGFEGLLKGLLSEAVYTHARFTRPSADVQDVLESWNRVWVALEARAVQRESGFEEGADVA